MDGTEGEIPKYGTPPDPVGGVFVVLELLFQLRICHRLQASVRAGGAASLRIRQSLGHRFNRVLCSQADPLARLLQRRKREDRIGDASGDQRPEQEMSLPGMAIGTPESDDQYQHAVEE